ncbi:hypothetical protein BUALT_Bualt12G0139300 [Buddleja alternifolia]|uniref:Auxin-responsive protein n=1 Tax=Buddleja alternifolia TaxID=168488 RepID=A0AAV6WQ29_9LAMI|nr:hypothetical protein BUALT_Bualt12G0139300 [Buddleja alternifolia]
MEGAAVMNSHESGLNLKATELRLGLPGCIDESEVTISAAKNNNKRASPEAQIVGWPPVRSHRKNSVQTKKTELMSESGIYVKVSLDGAPYLRKIDLKVYSGYSELLKALETMFKLTIDVIFYDHVFEALGMIDGIDPDRIILIQDFYAICLWMILGGILLMNVFASSGEYSERECYKGSEFAPAYEDKDGDLMLVGDVPWK